MEKNFIPNILICGDKQEFLSQVAQRAFKIVGQIEFIGDNVNFFQTGKFLLDGEFHDHTEFQNILGGG